MSRFASFAITLAMSCAAMPALASAATVSVAHQSFSGVHEGTVDRYVELGLIDRDGRADSIVITASSSGGSSAFRVTDSAGLDAGSGCVLDSPHEVHCPAGTAYEQATTKIQLGGGDDVLAVHGSLLSVGASGGDGNDTLEGPSADDKYIPDYTGGAGDDRLAAGPAAYSAQLSGGPGADTIDVGRPRVTDLLYQSSTTGIRLDLRAGRGTAGDARGDRIVGIPGTLYGSGHDDAIQAPASGSLIYSGAGDDVVTGGDGRDIIDGGTGRNILRGGAGNDELTAGTGADTFSGGAGRDSVDEVGQHDVVLLRQGGRDRVDCRFSKIRVPQARIDVDRTDTINRSCPKRIVHRGSKRPG